MKIETPSSRKKPTCSMVIFLLLAITTGIFAYAVAVSISSMGPEAQVKNGGRLIVIHLPVETGRRQEEVTIFDNNPSLLPRLVTRAYNGRPQKGDTYTEIRLSKAAWQDIDTLRAQLCAQENQTKGIFQQVDAANSYVIGIRCENYNGVYGKRIVVESKDLPPVLQSVLLSVPKLPTTIR